MALSKQEQVTLESIVIGSENDPLRPEFPPDSPKFPATPTFKIEVAGFSNVYLKDESVNLTGTHKDRMAWEMVVTYHDLLLQKEKGLIRGELPQMSIISSGSAAVAIQTMLHKYNLPNLKVLVDVNLDKPIKDFLRKIGAEVFETELGKKALNWREILALTNNQAGIDITSNEALDPTTRFYDWMSYEILNSSPAYCFLPFGSGSLYQNVLNINKKEISSKNHDPRFRGNVKALRECNFIGATTNNPKSRADKLYSPHLPFVHVDEQWIQTYKYLGYCGPESNVYLIQEEYLDYAMEIAQEQGISCEPSGISGLAVMLQMKNRLPKNKKMLIVNTGKTKYNI